MTLFCRQKERMAVEHVGLVFFVWDTGMEVALAKIEAHESLHLSFFLFGKKKERECFVPQTLILLCCLYSSKGRRKVPHTAAGINKRKGIIRHTFKTHMGKSVACAQTKCHGK